MNTYFKLKKRLFVKDMYKISLYLLFSFLLSGCTTTIMEGSLQRNCRRMKMKVYNIGYSHAVKGERTNSFNTTINQCASYGIILNYSEYYRGWTSGTDVFCTYKRGYEFGRYGKRYYKICSKGREADFLRGYVLGMKEYERMEKERSLREQQIQREKILFEREQQAQRKQEIFEKARQVRREQELFEKERQQAQREQEIFEKKLQQAHREQEIREREQKEQKRQEQARQAQYEKERFMREQRQTYSGKKSVRERQARLEQERRERAEQTRQAQYEKERFMREQSRTTAGKRT